MTLGKILLTAVALAILALPAVADIIFLKDGRMLHVEILAGSERGIDVRRLDTQGKLFIRWDLLRDEDKKRLRIGFGFEDDDSGADLVMDGHRVFVLRGDYYDGLIESQDQKQVVIRTSGRLFTILRHGVRGIEERRVSVFDVYTPAELYDQRLGEIQPTDDDTVGHFEMADWATKIGVFDRAIYHFAKAREADPEHRADFVDNQLVRLEELNRHKEIRTAIRDAEKRGRQHKYKECFGLLDVVAKSDGLPDVIRAEVLKKKELFAKRRWKYYTTVVEREYQREVIKRINKLSRSKDIKSSDKAKRLTIDKAMSYLRSKLHKDIVAHLAKKHELDPKREVEKMWKDRRARVKRTASYGNGTFIIEKSGGSRGGRQNANRAQQLQDLLRRAGGGRGGNNNQSNNTVRPPKLISKQRWWIGVEASVRSSWLRAFYAENARQLEVVSTRRRPCPECGATGSLKRLGTQGSVVKVTCPRCHGTKGDKIITYK
ncbi:MAG: hypothetical protein V3W41_10290 [Planctomycetota bacterium]